MKPCVFVDTDILLDLLSCRKPFHIPAARLLSLAERGAIEACVSSLSFATLSYLLRKSIPAARVKEALLSLRELVTVLPVHDAIIEKALHSRFSDFEDAVQYFAALEKGASALLTRNIGDYIKSAIRVCTAEEFLAGEETFKTGDSPT